MKFKRLLPVLFVFSFALPGYAAEKPPPVSCHEIQGVDPLLRKRQVLILGEMHGTNEIPTFVADVACRGLRTVRAVTVALEIPTEEEPRVTAYLASRGKAEDQAALLAGSFWRETFQDGRRSKGMLSLLDDLRRLREEGRDLRVKLLDRRPTASGPERDRAMAEELEAAVKAHPDDLFVVLIGNVHARTVRGTPWDTNLENTGYLVSQHVPGVVALDAAYSDGTVWICPEPNPASCSPQKIHGNSDGHTPGVKLYDKVSKDGFNGEYYVGALTASPPASPEKNGKNRL